MPYTLHRGDALTALAAVPDSSVDALITDPPWRGIASWHKPVLRPQKGRLKQFCEYIVWGTKGQVDANRNPVHLPGLYSASQLRKGRVHITQRPVDVMQELVRICPPDSTVLAPFTDSGTTGVAALREGRTFVGIELSDHYADIAERRLQGALTQGDFELAGPER
ncbi:DNA methyltransferase [Streptomyces sp. NPDC056975]|uniref:DNA methyltransferase n=1 Tax=Streptomyces sp. NPDC056975 TaxID=3345985 RepID=UPI00362EF1BE